MSKFCKSCGKPNDDDAKHCIYCGEKLDNSKETSVSVKPDKHSLHTLTLILAIISIAVGVIECLSAPMLLGFNEVIISMFVVIIGGILAIYLMKKEEFLISGIEFISIAVVLLLFLGRFALIGTILFIITAILVLYFKGTYCSTKKLLSIPILTIVLTFVILILIGGFSAFNAQNSIEIGNVTDSIVYSYGYYDGNIEGDIKVDTDFDYLKVSIDYYDSQGKIVESGIAWNDLNVKGGNTYHFSHMYIDHVQPTTAKLSVYDNSKGENPLYTENITLS